MTYYYIKRQDELYHYGIKGMKWGRRKMLEASRMRRKGNSVGDIVRSNIRSQLNTAKRERNRHTTAGHIVSAMGKQFVHGVAAGFIMSAPVALIAGPRALNSRPMQLGLRAVGAMITTNYTAEAAARIYYKYSMPKPKKKK